MSVLRTFSQDARAVVIGASGGIGSAVTRQLLADPGIYRVHALSRGAETVDGASNDRIDLTNERSIAAAADRIRAQGPVDLVFIATGMLHDGDRVQPEKRMRDLDAANMHRLFAVNAVGPALVAKHFLPQLRRDAKTVLATVSARVGSISDNGLGGWASYRASKAALNMLVKTLAIEHARSRPDSAVIALHPGTVDTDLSKPFQGNVPDGKLFTAEFSAERLLAVIDDVTSSDSGGFFAWDGSRIDY